MILKARQFGISTNGILDLLDYTVWQKNATSCILAHEQDSIKKLFRIVARAYDALDPDIKPQIDRGGGSKYEHYYPEINSRIYCDLESRGDTIQRIHISEAAFMKNPDKLLSTLQAVPLNGRVTIESTPNGMGNFFYDMWNDPQSPYKKFFFPWFMHDEYRIPTEPLQLTAEEKEMVINAGSRYGVIVDHQQIAFRRFKQAELGKLFIQEYPEDDQSCFLASGGAAMDLVVVKSILDLAPEPISDNGTLKIYKPYDKTQRYVCGADTAEGIGGDYSVGCMYNARTREQVAVLRGHIKPADFAHGLDALCKMYTTGGCMHPVLAVERNNHGHAVLLYLQELCHYPNLYVHTDERAGWLTDRVTRPIMLDDFIDGVENQTAIINDKTTLRECLTLVVENGKIQAAEGKHDDTVIAASIGLQMCMNARALDVYDDIGSKIMV